ncbi:hypothetical protein MANES_16G137450v8 [Manihot esculenta]|uniref:Uncharacterized protein n=1 Tax=Manihot esculenta TaxID=3983 RepID=A0ACB7G9I5_MANES|nr:hypothetical protein MANES_16G137450v8 [Manihot esculenta]
MIKWTKICSISRPWQFDVDALHKEKENSYTFTWSRKKITILPFGSAKYSKVEGKNTAVVSTGVQRLSSAVEKSEGTLALLVRAIGAAEDALSLPPPVKELLKEFSRIVEESSKLLPLRDIQHQIALILESKLPNLPYYKMSPKESAIL